MCTFVFVIGMQVNVINVGVSFRQAYEVKKIDNYYFGEE